MKKLFLYSLILFSAGCHADIELVSAVKQIILPGLPNAERYVNYQLEVAVKKESTLRLDAVLVWVDNECYDVDFSVKSKATNQLVDNLGTPGAYVLNVPLRGNKKHLSDNCSATSESVTVIYQHQNNVQNLVVSSFQETKITRR